jgi:hypothetical protein
MKNKKRDKNTKLFLMLSLAVLTTGCVMTDSNKQSSVEYYRSFSGYDLPLRLIDKTTKEEAEANEKKAAYYVAHFDSDRKLVRVVKMFRGNVLFEDRYFYYPNGKLKRREGKNEIGVLIMQEFDETGKLKSK